MNWITDRSPGHDDRYIYTSPKCGGVGRVRARSVAQFWDSDPQPWMEIKVPEPYVPPKPRRAIITASSSEGGEWRTHRGMAVDDVEFAKFAQIMRGDPDFDELLEAARQLKFIECDSCRKKSGTPMLCHGCLANREAIYRVTEVLEPKQ